MPRKKIKFNKAQELMIKGLRDFNIKRGSGAGPIIPINPLKNRKYTVDKSGRVEFQKSGGKISKYYASGGNVITGRD